MASYHRNCNGCGQLIVMAEGAHSWQPMEPDGSGRHHCGSHVHVQRAPAAAPAPALSWDFPTLKTAVTYFTSCWWCHEPVFFHRANDGGCVLFDNLEDRPWAVHGCWLEHREQQPQALTRIRTDLVHANFSGDFYQAQRTQVRYRPGQATTISVHGYVADNFIAYDDNPRVFLRASRASTTAPLVNVQVADSKNRAYNFLLPEAAAQQLRDFQLVTVRGIWLQRRKRWLPLATELQHESYGTAQTISIVGVPPTTTRCCACRTTLEYDWGFDPLYQRECRTCASMRRDMTPDDFRAHCRKIGKNRIKGGNT